MARSLREVIPARKARVYNGVKVTNMEDVPIRVKVEPAAHVMRDPHPPEVDEDNEPEMP